MKLLEHFKELSLHPKNAEELKGMILRLAIQGKLTAQWREENPDVESASELLKLHKVDIQDISLNTDLVIRLPETWTNVKFSDIFRATQGIQLPKNQQKESLTKGYKKYLYISDFKQNGTPKYVLDQYPNKEVTTNTLVMTNTGATAGQVLSGQEGILSNNLFKIDYPSFCIRDYVELFLKSPLFYGVVSGTLKGGANPHMGHKRFYSWDFNLPPTEEQKAIVEVVNKLFKEVDQLESLTKERIHLKESFVVSALNRLTEAENTQEEWNFLQKHFSSFFTEKKNIKSLRETILQLAVQGKLTEDWRTNNPNTETASELLKRIEAEKQQLIAEKKIRKEKPLPPIEDDEIPYELPKGWLFMRLGELVTLKSGSTVSKALEFNKGDYMYVKVGGMNLPGNEKIITTSELYVKSDPKIENALIPANSIIFPKRGGAIATNKKRVVNQSILVDLNTMAMICPASFCFDYLKNWFDSIDLWLLNNGTSVPQINNKDINPLIISIPPIEEQKAIVEKVNSLMALCDELEQQIETSQTQIEILMQSCLKEVFEQA